jgi:hypothetical protein
MLMARQQSMQFDSTRMYNDTVVLRNGDSANEKSLALIDGPTNQKTLRSSADGALKLSIAHQESNENPGFITRRTNVRVTLSKEVEDTGKSVDAYVQLTISSPKDVVTVVEVQRLAVYISNFLQDKGESAGVDADLNSDLLLAVPRLLAGEP